jgi:hypothetical protein
VNVFSLVALEGDRTSCAVGTLRLYHSQVKAMTGDPDMFSKRPETQSLFKIEVSIKAVTSIPVSYDEDIQPIQCQQTITCERYVPLAR